MGTATVGGRNAGGRRKKSAASAAAREICSVRVGTALFGVPIKHILEIVAGTRPEPVPLAPGFVGGLAHYRGDVLTTVSLRRLLDLAPREGPQDMLVVESAGGCFGLLVDSVGEVLTVAEEEFEDKSLDHERAAAPVVCRNVQAERWAHGVAGPRAAGSDSAGGDGLRGGSGCGR